MLAEFNGRSPCTTTDFATFPKSGRVVVVFVSIRQSNVDTATCGRAPSRSAIREGARSARAAAQVVQAVPFKAGERNGGAPPLWLAL